MFSLYKVELFYKEDSHLCRTYYSVIHEDKNRTDAIKAVKKELVGIGVDPNNYYYLGSYISYNVVVDRNCTKIVH